MDEELTPTAGDNAGGLSLDEQIQNILDEGSEEQSEETPKETETIEIEESDEEESQTKNEYPEDFLNEDGSVKVDDLVKAYKELKPLQEQKEKWEQEKKELEEQAEFGKQLKAQQEAQAFQLGYKNSEELELIKKVAAAQAGEYAKYLYLVENPDKVRGMLALYAQSPNPNLLEQIENEFEVDVVKNISVLAERYKYQLEREQETQRYETIRKEAETFVNNSMKEFQEWFKIPEFTNFFADALRIKGDSFATADFIKHIENLKEYFRKEFISEQQTNTENEKEKNSLKNLSPKTSPKISTTKKLEDYSPEELDLAISELI